MENQDQLVLLAALLSGVALIALAVGLLIQSNRKERALKRIDELVSERRRAQNISLSREDMAMTALSTRFDKLGEKLSRSRYFSMLTEEEDKKLLGRAGLGGEENLNRYVLLRVLLSAVAVGVWFVVSSSYTDTTTRMVQFVGLLGLGYMAPKWILRAYATAQEAAFEKEIVALVDVMRLLQGVGLGLEQSMEVIATQLQDIVPITGKILYRARTQVKSGVTWNTVLKNMTKTYSSPEFKSFVAVLGQIEKYGGAVQEPLRQFSERLIEKQRASIKETIGKLTVKITGIMVITMMPALLIVAGGPGVLSISRAF